MNNIVFKRIYAEPEFDCKEILRYAGCNEPSKEVLNLMHTCIEEAKSKFSYKVCYIETPVNITENGIDLSFVSTASASLKKNLEHCNKAVVFAATVGLEIDRLIAKYGKISPAKGHMFQAIGAERIESLCDIFCHDILKENKNAFLKPRFSPGYGDLPISLQKDIFKVLDCYKQIGLTLNDSMLMSPTKSVTAIVGITEKPTDCERSCSSCNLKNCFFRSE